MNQEFDTNQAIKEADAYVRDHLLIQWMMGHLYLFDRRSTIEEIYQEWYDYILKKEAEHDKRSEI